MKDSKPPQLKPRPTKCLTLLVRGIVLFVALNIQASAGFKVPPNSTPKSAFRENIGFMRDVPSSWIKKFPMCDHFLDVHWIDRKKEAGYAKYNLYINHKLSRRTYTTLVALQGYAPHYDLDVDKVLKRGGISALRAVVKSMHGLDFFPTGFPSIASSFASPNAPPPAVSLDDYRANICIPFPAAGATHAEEQTSSTKVKEAAAPTRVWIAEIKRADQVYSSKQLEREYELVRHALRPPGVYRWNAYDERKAFRRYGVLDDCGPAHRACFIPGSGGINIAYPFRGKYYPASPDWRDSGSKDYGVYRFSVSGQECSLGVPSDFYVTTNGSRYYINNFCNLTVETR